MKTFYYCDVCGKTFENEAEAKEHEALHAQKEEASKRLLKQMEEAKNDVDSAYKTYKEKLKKYEEIKGKYYDSCEQTHCTLKDLMDEMLGGR